ncbi:MAG: hypothetical protein V4706_02755 [Pseudomonadota bacterium]
MSAAVKYIIKRMHQDPRLAYILGPGSEAFDLLTAEAAVMAEMPVDQYREILGRLLRTEPIPTERSIQCRIDDAVRDALAKVKR